MRKILWNGLMVCGKRKGAVCGKICGMGNSYLIWLEWPERCFRASEGDMRLFRSLVPKGSRVVRARSKGAFLKALPGATHAVVWHFEKEWYARAPKLRVLATPAAGRELVAWRDAPEGVKVHFGTFHGPIISETVLGFLLAWTRGFFWKGPMWPRAELAAHCGDLQGTTAVIAGFGRIGRAIAEKLGLEGVFSGGDLIDAGLALVVGQGVFVGTLGAFLRKGYGCEGHGLLRRGVLEGQGYAAVLGRERQDQQQGCDAGEKPADSIVHKWKHTILSNSSADFRNHIIRHLHRRGV